MIYVTEEQAKVIDFAISTINEQGVSKGYACYRAWLEIESLDLVTIASIIEGESYEIKREFKVGDIVFDYKDDSLYEVVNTPHKPSNQIFITTGYAETHRSTLKLVCAVENREDLKEASADDKR